MSTHQGPNYIISTNENPLPHDLDDHEMHGLVDESSIEQIDDHSMISNPMFPEDTEFERGLYEPDEKRKGSTDEWHLMNQKLEGVANQKVVRPPSSKKMSKKKTKRETVEVMDPASFL